MNKKKVSIIGGILAALTIVGVVSTAMCIEKVKPGYVGVVYSPSTGVSDEILTQGWHLVNPLKKVTSFTVATEQFFMSADERDGSKENESFDVRCKDGKMNVDLEMSYSYDQDRIPDLFKKYRGMDGATIFNNVIRGKIKTYVNETTAKYSVLEAHVEKKTELNAEILKVLQDKLKDFGVIVESANLMNTRVDASIEAAITERSKAAQELEAEKQKQEKARVEAERLKIEAEGKKEVEIINAEAQAESNRIMSESLNTEVLQQQWIEKWTGSLPQATGGNSMIFGPAKQ